jgi:hypothetical protein
MRIVPGLVAASILLAWSLAYLEHVWIYIFMLVDVFTPWVLFDSPLFAAYHDFLLARRPIVAELPLPELNADSFTKEDVLRLSKGYTFPVVIRRLLVNTSSVSKWSSGEWWVENYGNEPTLCGTFDSVRATCVVKDFFDAVQNNESFYISGASKLFANNAELGDMIEDPRVKQLEPGPHVATQIFMGLTDMGSDIHSAMGVNIFRMIVGSKKWWFIPPSQTPYLKPSINVNGFSAHTHTMVGKNGEEVSTWMNKLERYTTVLHPGDVLINPPWFWHGILNQGLFGLYCL